MAIEYAFFDVGSTLLYPSPDVPETFVSSARMRGHEVSLEVVRAAMPLADALYDEEYVRDGDFWCSHDRSVAVWKDMYKLLAHESGLAFDAEGIADVTYEQYLHAHHWALYEDVRPALKALKARGLHLGIISNWDAKLEALIRDLGLLPYFDVVIASAAIGYRKPNPRIFEEALSAAGVTADRAIHVGDLPEADGAAIDAGIVPVIIDRKGVQGRCGLRVVRSLVELGGVVDELDGVR